MVKFGQQKNAKIISGEHPIKFGGVKLLHDPNGIGVVPHPKNGSK